LVTSYRLYDCYKILGVTVGAKREDIVSSYKQLCREFHPDVSDEIDAEEQMKRINLAYGVLCDKWKLEDRLKRARGRSVYTPPKPHRAYTPPSAAADVNAITAEKPKDAGAEDIAAARAVMDCYFKALESGEYERAYGYLSDYDKKCTKLSGFRDWRLSVERLYRIQAHTIKERDFGSAVSFGDGTVYPARKFTVCVSEISRSKGTRSSETFDKIAIFENGRWRVFLGYKDIGAIARTFRELLEKTRREDDEKNFRKWKEENCGELGVLSLNGFLKQLRREEYSYKRYSRQFALAVFALDVEAPQNRPRREDILKAAADTLSSALRLTDVVGYCGDGKLAVCFADMRKRHAAQVTRRLAETIKAELEKIPGIRPSLSHASRPFSGGSVQDVFASLLERATETV